MTQIDIFNGALAQLGHDQDVITLTDKTAVAAWCNRFYDQDRVELLRMLAPGFARMYADLGTGNTISDNNEWSYSFNVPEDCVRVLSVKDPAGTGDVQTSFKIFQGQIFCNIQNAKIEYVQNVTDTTLFDSLFIRALMLKIAADIATPLTGQNALRKQALQELAYAMADSRNMDGQDAREVGNPSDPNWWANCRGAKYDPGFGDSTGTYYAGNNR